MERTWLRKGRRFAELAIRCYAQSEKSLFTLRFFFSMFTGDRTLLHLCGRVACGRPDNQTSLPPSVTPCGCHVHDK
ncbi:Uncharacterized protein TCM_008599 [Theobroma cacao]|uniref:Uncharacterized protein n=1 Tax=Theobroma cacao TaxID=3641 RepID=A0A061E5Y2_THECC|nr:Uncharacterized protein TCM_008599 [Theobroma cacao]